MQTKFKRHQKVKLLIAPDPEYVEYHNEEEDTEDNENRPEIRKGMMGEINMLLPNGQYHIKITDKKGNIIAYAPMSEEALEAV